VSWRGIHRGEKEHGRCNGERVLLDLNTLVRGGPKRERLTSRVRHKRGKKSKQPRTQWGTYRKLFIVKVRKGKRRGQKKQGLMKWKEPKEEQPTKGGN